MTAIEATLALLTSAAFVGGLSKLGKWLFDHWHEMRVKDGLRRTRRVYHILHEILADTGAQRITIAKAHNGNGIPSPGAPTYISVYYEVVRTGHDLISDDFQRQPIDHQIADLLHDLTHDACIEKHRKDMEDGTIAAYHDALGIDHTHFGLVALHKRGLLFIALNFGGSDPLCPMEKMRMQTSVNEIRRLFRGKQAPIC